MNLNYLLLGAFVCSLSLFVQSSRLEDPDIQNGLKAGDKLLDALDGTKFEEVVPQLAELTLPFMEVLAELIQILQNKNSEEDLDKVNEILFNYNQRLRKLTTEFSDVRRMIDWSAAKINYAELERSIVALKQNMDNAFNAPSDVQDDQKQYYIKMFENDYHNAATKLYTSLTSEHMVFSENLIYLSRKYTRNHRSLVHHFLLGVYKLIMEGIELEATYMIFKGYISSINFIKKTWETRLDAVKGSFLRADKDIVMKWFDQANMDVDLFSHQNRNITQTTPPFVDRIYHFLAEKYFWRSWLVIVHDEPSDNYCLATINCFESIGRRLGDGRSLLLVSAPTNNFNESGFNASIGRIQSKLERKLHAAQPARCQWLMDSIKALSAVYDGPCSNPDLKFVSLFSVQLGVSVRGHERHMRLFNHNATSLLINHKFKVILFA